MNSHEFVKALKIVACHNVSTGVLKLLLDPPGRSPDARMVRLSNWVNGLAPEGKEAVQEVIELAANQAVYNVLLVLDGLLAISPTDQKIELQLIAKDAEGSAFLNDFSQQSLTDLFKQS